MTDELARQVWEWLPGRTDSRRVTLPATCAAHLGVSAHEVALTLDRMESEGYAVRDRALGRQSGWHRGKPYPLESTSPDIVEAWGLF